MTIQDTDSFIVNRNGTNYRQAASNIMAIQDTDLLLVNRGGTNYKVTGTEVKDYVGVGVVIYFPTEGESLTQSTINVKSSVWYSTTGVTHLSSTWQIALSTDPTFSNPVKQTVDSTTELNSWYVAGLIPGTSYLVKVTYNLSDSSTANSNTVAFSVAASASPFTVSPPSSLVSAAYAVTNPVSQYVSPVSLNSLRWSPAGVILLATTTSGRIMSFSLSSATSIGTGQLNTTPLPNGDLAYDAFLGSTANATYYVNQEGYIKSVGSPPTTLPASLLSQKIVSVSPYDQMGSVSILTENDEVWVATSDRAQVGQTGNGTIPVGASSYILAWSPTSQNYFTAPSGEKPIKVVSYYYNYVIWLTDANNAYVTGPMSITGASLPSVNQQGIGATNASPVKIRPYPFGTASDYVWDDIFSADLNDFGGAVQNVYTFGFWGYTSDGKVRGAYGYTGEINATGSTLGATDPGWFGDKVVKGVTGTWGFAWSGTSFGTVGTYYYDENDDVFYTTGWTAGSQVTVEIPGVGAYFRNQPLAFGFNVNTALNFKLLQSKPVDVV